MREYKEKTDHWVLIWGPIVVLGLFVWWLY